MSLKKYIAEAEVRQHIPQSGDVFAIELEDGTLLETYVMSMQDNVIVLDATSKMISILSEWADLDGEAGDVLLEGQFDTSMAEEQYTMDNEQYQQEVDVVDRGEYDYEGDMAKDDLATIIRAARKLTGMLDDDENMPEWVQSKINKAADYVDTAADYIESNKQRAGEQVNELSPDLLNRAAQAAKNKSNQAMDPKIHDALGGGYMNPLAKHYDTMSDKFSNRAAKVGQRDAVKTIASPAVMRKIGMAEGLFGIEDKIKGRIQNVVSDLSDIPGMWDHKRQTFTDTGMEKLKSVLKNNPKYIKYALNLTYKDYEAEGVAEDNLKEFAPGSGGGSGDYFQALASAWYNGTFDSGSLEKGIKSQQDVERLLNRGIIGPDGVTRKYAIAYNSTFDGVVISSDDYYEHSDYNDQGQEVDSRNGQPWGPNDYMEFSDDDLSEGVAEDNMDEAKYQGREVPLGKPMRGDTKKFKVYVRDPSTGNIKKVNFGHGGTSAKRLGQKTMKIKKSDPARRRSFRARHNCDNPGSRLKARYWSCRAW